MTERDSRSFLPGERPRDASALAGLACISKVRSTNEPEAALADGRFRAALALTLGFAMTLSACGTGAATTRVFDGNPVEGRWISPRAYAAHAEGAYLEAQGRLEEAEVAYQRALESDPDSPGTWARIGAVRCERSLEHALEAYDRSLSADPTYAAGWSEKALCLLHHRRHEDAIAAAERSLEHDADAVLPTLVAARALMARAQPDAALRWLWALVVRDASRIEAWRAAHDVAPENSALWWAARDELRAQHAARNAAPFTAKTRGGTPTIRGTTRALLDDDLEAARGLALGEEVSPVGLADLALGLGKPRLALRQAELVLQANPGDADARVIAWMATALLAENPEGLELIGAKPSGRLTPLSTMGARRLTQLLDWYVGSDAARALSSGHGRFDARSRARPQGDEPAGESD